MLEAANWAPTHGKTEPWRFVVLSEDALQEMIGITHQVSNVRLQAVNASFTSTYAYSCQLEYWTVVHCLNNGAVLNLHAS